MSARPVCEAGSLEISAGVPTATMGQYTTKTRENKPGSGPQKYYRPFNIDLMRDARSLSDTGF